MFKPWSTIDDEELKALRAVAERATKLERGCNCDYDYRCNNCQTVIDTRELAQKALKR